MGFAFINKWEYIFISILSLSSDPAGVQTGWRDLFLLAHLQSPKSVCASQENQYLSHTASEAQAVYFSISVLFKLVVR